MPTTAPSRPATPGRGGVWEPLPSIIYGYAVHPLSPSHRDTRISSRPRLSTVTEASTAESLIHRDVVALEVGDEVYAFEKYTPRAKETEGVWYRGCVVSRSSMQRSGLNYHLAMLSVPLDALPCPGMYPLTHHRPADQGSKNLSKFLSAYSPDRTSSFGRNCPMLRGVLPTSQQPSRMAHISLAQMVPNPELLVVLEEMTKRKIFRQCVNLSSLVLPPIRQIPPEPVSPCTLRAFAPCHRQNHKM
jgi:hypothetical protein